MMVKTDYNTNISFIVKGGNLPSKNKLALIMKQEEIETFVRIASKGDTTQIEALFKKPGGRKFLETTILLLVNQLTVSEYEKMERLQSFIEVFDNMEERIKHQKRGNKILKQAFENID